MRKYFVLIVIFCVSVISAQQNQWTWVDLSGSTPTTRNVVPGEILPEPVVLKTVYDSNNNVLNESSTAQAKRYTIDFSISGFLTRNRTEDETTYSELKVPGWGCSAGKTGEPNIPLKKLFIELPPDQNMTPTVTMTEQNNLSGIKVYPNQEPLPDCACDSCNTTFRVDQELYQRNQYFVTSNVETEVVWIRNHKFLKLDIIPFQNNPVTGDLKIQESISIEVILTDDNSGIAEERAQLRSSALDAMLEPGIGVPRGTYGIFGPDVYMVLINDQFANNGTLQEFVDWKKTKGYDVIVKKTSEIPGGTSQADIDSYLANLAGTYPLQYPSYLLIIGDESQTSGVEGKYVQGLYGGYSDLEFACENNDNWFFPDIFYGRMPAKNSTECTAILSKAISMDKTAPVSSSSMYDRTLVAMQVQDRDMWGNKDNRASRLFLETADAVAFYFEKDAGGIDYTCTRAQVNPDGMTFPGGSWYTDGLWDRSGILWSGEEIDEATYTHFVSDVAAINSIKETINNGCVLVQHRDHGDVHEWGNPSFTSNDIRNLSNGDLRPIVLSTNCLTGAYHRKGDQGQENFTRAFLNHSNGGAYAVISAVDVSYSWYNDYFVHGMFSSLFENYRSFHNTSTAPDWTKNLPAPVNFEEGSGRKPGKMLNFGKMYMFNNYGDPSYQKTTYDLFHVFGDPEADVVIHEPRTPVVTATEYIRAFRSATVEITVDGNADGALVSLCNSDFSVHNSELTENGDVTIVVQLTGPVEDHLDLTVTGFGLRPLTIIDAVEVVPPFVQPTGAQDCYSIGDKVYFNDGFYESTIDFNVWSPVAYPAGWNQLATYPSACSPWIRPTGPADCYNIGDKVSFNGEGYKSIISCNIWSPTEYPAGWISVSCD